MQRLMDRGHAAARLTAALLLAWALPAPGQDGPWRAELGDQIASTKVGADYSEALSSMVAEARRKCAAAGLPLQAGDMVTIVADVMQDGAWSNVVVDPASAAANCHVRELIAAKRPAPEGWDWKQGEFPLTLRLGVGLAKGP